jgi:hypothetical protein
MFETPAQRTLLAVNKQGLTDRSSARFKKLQPQLLKFPPTATTFMAMHKVDSW